MCGGVKIVRYETPYVVTGGVQAYRLIARHLKVYAQIGLSERGKQSNTEVIADC